MGLRKTLRPARTCSIAPRTAATARCRREKRLALPWRSSPGVASTSRSRQTGAADPIASAFSWPWKTPTVVNMITPSTVSASRLRSVCETTVPSTIGNRSRTRPSRRDTISAREGSPRRAGSVADISTPIITPRAASRRRTRVPGSAERNTACQDSARSSIEAHIRPKASSTQVGVAAITALLIEWIPMRWSAIQPSPAAASVAATTATLRA